MTRVTKEQISDLAFRATRRDSRHGTMPFVVQ